MKKRIFASFLLALTVMAVGAVPAKPGLFRMLKLSDGTMVKARLVGDEHGHFWVAEDGKAFRKVRGTDHFAETDTKAIETKAAERRARANAARPQRLKQRKSPQETGFFGEKKCLIILVNFSDMKFKASNNIALYQRIANEKGFSEGNFVGSMYDYFYAQSEGLFELTFDVVEVTVSEGYAYYGENDAADEDVRPGEMVREAVILADAEVNFADYDWDGDGEVDQIYVVYAGMNEAGGGDEDTIWPHAWSLSGSGAGRVRLDGVYVDNYACGGELNESGSIDGIGTMCHEFSHCLGYPDFYDINYKAPGMGYWSLMDGGSYNGDGYCPAGYTSYERWVAGWKEPIELTEDTEITGMKALQSGGDAYVIYNDGNRNEYFLLENRQFIGWDAEIPGKGLLILHVDYNSRIWTMNTVNSEENHQRMTWISADNRKKYTVDNGDRYYDFDDMATDTYPYENNNSFTNTSKPAANVFNKNTDGSKKLNKSVTEITRNSDGTVSFTFKSSAGSTDPTGDGNYKRITTLGDLEENAEYLIVYEASDTEGTAYAGYDSSRNIGKKVDIAIDAYTTDGTDANPVKLERADGEKWYIMDGSSYLYYYGSSNKLYASETKGNSGYKWTISTNDITNADFSNRKLQYNASANGLRFACYTGSQEDVVLYKKTESVMGVKMLKTDVKNQGIYTLQGVKIPTQTPLQPGIYIQNGRKIIVK